MKSEAQLFTDLLLKFQTIPKHFRPKTTLEIYNSAHRENAISSLLVFFFDPNNEHKLQYLFIESLFNCLNIDLPHKLDNLNVSREVVTEKGNRIDIIIEIDDYIIGIENKIFNGIQNDLEDYSNYIKDCCKFSKKPINILLTLNAIKKENDLDKIKRTQFENITYQSFFDKIRLNIGKYLNHTNNSYTNILMDFISSIENLNPQTMTNKELISFFRDNGEIALELKNSLIDYFKYCISEVQSLRDYFPKNEFSPLSKYQWIWDGVKDEGIQAWALVHDYIIEQFAISIDTTIDNNGWSITLFARNTVGIKYLLETMSQDAKIKNLNTNPEKTNDNRLIIKKFDFDEDKSQIIDCLKNVLNAVESYKQEVETNGVKQF